MIAATISVQALKAQTADEIINKFIEAIGGKEKMLALKSIKSEGALTVQGAEVSITSTTLSGVGSRTDISVPGIDPGFRIITPTKGWNFAPYLGQTSPEEVSEEQLKAGQAGLDLQTPFLNYKEKGHQVELLGKEKLDGVDCYKIKITYKNGVNATSYFDANTFYRVKTIAKGNVRGQMMDVETRYSDFRKLPEGYVIPFKQVSPNGELNVSTVEINKPVDESIFVAK